jgi:hypothetical protein
LKILTRIQNPGPNITLSNKQVQESEKEIIVVNPETVGTLIVPAKDLDQYVSALTSNGFTIDSTHTFQDLRGGQGDTGPEQTLIVWTTLGMNIDQVISALEEITPSLPYS